MVMKRLVMLALLLASACSQPSRQPVPVRQGMSEQQVIKAYNARLPDRILETTCGTATAVPFACKVYVYEARRDQARQSVVFEKVGGTWLVGQWL